MQRRGVVGEVGEDAVLRAALVVHKVLCEVLVHAERGGAGERLAGGAVEGPELLLAPDELHTGFGELFTRTLVGVMGVPIGGDARDEAAGGRAEDGVLGLGFLHQAQEARRLGGLVAEVSVASLFKEGEVGVVGGRGTGG